MLNFFRASREPSLNLLVVSFKKAVSCPQDDFVQRLLPLHSVVAIFQYMPPVYHFSTRQIFSQNIYTHTHTHTPRVYKPKFHGGGFDPLPKCSGRWVVDPTPGVGRPREFECSEIRQGNFHILTKEFHYLTSFLTAQRKFCDFNKENPLLLTDS